MTPFEEAVRSGRVKINDPEYWRLYRAQFEKQETALPPHPEPEHTSRDPWPADVALPEGARRLKALAESHGWAVGQSYSRGWSVHGVTGKPCAFGGRIALRMMHPETGNRCIVIYRLTDSGGTAESTFVLGPSLPPYTGCNVTEVSEFIALAGRVLPSWLDAVRHRNWLAGNTDKIWAGYHDGATLSALAARFEQPREVIVKIIQDCRTAGKAAPTKGKSSKKEAGG